MELRRNPERKNAQPSSSNVKLVKRKKSKPSSSQSVVVEDSQSSSTTTTTTTSNISSTISQAKNQTSGNFKQEVLGVANSSLEPLDSTDNEDKVDQESKKIRRNSHPFLNTSSPTVVPLQSDSNLSAAEFPDFYLWEGKYFQLLIGYQKIKILILNLIQLALNWWWCIISIF